MSSLTVRQRSAARSWQVALKLAAILPPASTWQTVASVLIPQGGCIRGIGAIQMDVVVLDVVRAVPKACVEVRTVGWA